MKRKRVRELLSFVKFATTLNRLGLGNDEFMAQVAGIYYDSAERYSNELRDYECSKEEM